MPRQYTQDFKDRAVRMVFDHEKDYGSRTQTVIKVATQLGCSRERLRVWINQAEIDSGTRVGTTTSESHEMRRLRKEVRQLREANEILKAAAVFFAGELAPRNNE